jgi:hypothetical protein
MSIPTGVTPDVLTGLGLDPRLTPTGDGPLVEWRTAGGAGTPTTPTVELVGVTDATPDPGIEVTSIDLPVGTVAGDLILVGLFAGAFNNPITCDDPRIVGTAFRQDSSHSYSKAAFVGWGVADADLDPVSCFVHAGAGDLVAYVAVYRTVGDPGSATISQAGFQTTAPCIPDMPSDIAPCAGVLIVATTAGTHTIVDDNGNWTSDGSTPAPNTARARSFSCATGVPGAHIVQQSVGTECTVWAALSLRVDPPADDPDAETIWTPDPDRSHSLISYQLRYGRTDPRSKVQTVQITVSAAAPLSDPPEIGEPFRISLCDAAADVLGLTVDEAARFTGEVTDLAWDPARRVWTALGVGTVARKARTVLDLSTAPVESSHDRVVRILAAIEANRGTIDELREPVVGPVAAPAAAAAHIDGVVDSTLGALVQQLDGKVDWQDPEHRRGLTPAIVIGADEILNSLVWGKRVGGIVNTVTVNYLGGSVVITDHASVDARGPYPATVTTVLTDSSDATQLGSLIVSRFAVPVWDLPALTVDVARTIDPAHLVELFLLRFSSRLTIEDLPADGPIVGDHDFFLEGFTDTAARFSWRLGLAVSDPSRSGVSIRWVDVDPALQWEDVDPTLRWLDLSFEDPSLLGTPDLELMLDGGDAGAGAPALSIDGGDAGASGPYSHEIDGGLAA